LHRNRSRGALTAPLSRDTRRLSFPEQWFGYGAVLKNAAAHDTVAYRSISISYLSATENRSFSDEQA
jgi:hypothetical protein